jgi:dinuclear metal center YbgI/SA1388 family protein
MFQLKSSFNNLIKNFVRINNYKKYYSMDLQKVVKCLNEYAPKELAADWDNVGLLVEPSKPSLITKIMVTNDLTEAVLEEAIGLGINLIISYHPAIFNPLKKMIQDDWKSRSIIKLIENNIALYSPHTTWDSADGGMNDWLINLFNPISVQPVTVLKESSHPTGKGISLNVKFTTINTEELRDKIRRIENETLRFINFQDVGKLIEYELVSNENSLILLIDLIRSEFPEDTYKTLRISNLERPPKKNCGLARLGVLKEAISIEEVARILKYSTNLKYVRVALANGKTLCKFSLQFFSF